MTPITLRHSHIRRSSLHAPVLAAAIIFALGSPSPAMARQDPGPRLPTATRTACPVERIGSQIVRCDDLSGNGVAAPLWLPQQH
ncbi:hypothetical protein [Pedococcus sp. 5OH_020]|uniref:hypothetical protein n=1 Tax=Pedococcus sp. 5OH_020 TaxID=2989814 RepID=UPI0022E9A1FF|nr:hypothetical protein [Pedococcus sp. 5OH_020]